MVGTEIFLSFWSDLSFRQHGYLEKVCDQDHNLSGLTLSLLSSKHARKFVTFTPHGSGKVTPWNRVSDGRRIMLGHYISKSRKPLRFPDLGLEPWAGRRFSLSSMLREIDMALTARWRTGSLSAMHLLNHGLRKFVCDPLTTVLEWRGKRGS